MFRNELRFTMSWAFEIYTEMHGVDDQEHQGRQTTSCTWLVRGQCKQKTQTSVMDNSTPTNTTQATQLTIPYVQHQQKRSHKQRREEQQGVQWGRGNACPTRGVRRGTRHGHSKQRAHQLA